MAGVVLRRPKPGLGENGPGRVAVFLVERGVSGVRECAQAPDRSRFHSARGSGGRNGQILPTFGTGTHGTGRWLIAGILQSILTWETVPRRLHARPGICLGFRQARSLWGEPRCLDGRMVAGGRSSSRRNARASAGSPLPRSFHEVAGWKASGNGS